MTRHDRPTVPPANTVSRVTSAFAPASNQMDRIALKQWSMLTSSAQLCLKTASAKSPKPPSRRVVRPAQRRRKPKTP
jgi:hypothetical protein